MRRALATSTLLAAFVLLPSCQQKTIEYRRVPSWARHLGATESTHVNDDGSEVRWIYDQRGSDFIAVGTIGDDGDYVAGPSPAPPRQETPQGPILHCLLPMHVVVNLRECLTLEEYDVIWDQLLSPNQRDFYEQGGEAGRAAFERFLTQARKDLVTCLRRMEAGDVFGDVKTVMLDDNHLSMRLHGRVQGEFPVYGIVIAKVDDGTLRLHDILFKRKRKRRSGL
jgi:hypothetical protein